MPATTSSISAQVVQAARQLSRRVDELDFSSSVPWVYNPLDYAWSAHRQYLAKYAQSGCRVLFMGMNPGPWGMAQTGVPFGEIAAVREFLQIDAKIHRPAPEHPKRPVQGLACPRSEVSGRRLWGLFKDRFDTADRFFANHFVCNYCPLVFMEESARNVTPDKLPNDLRAPLETICDAHLARVIDLLRPEWVIGIGAFAENSAKRTIDNHQLPGLRVGRVLHPSPASPAANKDWAGTASKQLEQLGVWL